MAGTNWKRIARRAAADAAKASKLDGGQAAVFLIGQFLSSLVILALSGGLDWSTRIAAALIPFLVYPVLFLWKLRGAEERIRADARRIVRDEVREALASSDNRLLAYIDTGNLEFATRLREHDLRRIQAALKLELAKEIVSSFAVTGTMTGDSLNNGSFGPATAEAIQYRVQIALTEQARVTT